MPFYFSSITFTLQPAFSSLLLMFDASTAGTSKRYSFIGSSLLPGLVQIRRTMLPMASSTALSPGGLAAMVGLGVLAVPLARALRWIHFHLAAGCGGANLAFDSHRVTGNALLGTQDRNHRYAIECHPPTNEQLSGLTVVIW